MRRTSTGDYPPDWKAIAWRVKEEADWTCIRCRHPHDPGRGYTLTIHHLDINPANNRWWNLLPLCQRCHLSVQGRVIVERPWVLDHTPWFKPYVAGWYAARYLGQELSREEVEARLEERLALEADAVLGGPVGGVD